MSDRRRNARIKNNKVAYAAAIAVHIVIFSGLFINFASKPKQIEAAYAEKVDVVKATVINESQIKNQQDKLKKLEREKQRKKDQELARLRRLKEETKKQKKKIEYLKKQQKIEKEKVIELNKTIALKKKKDEEKRLKKEKERKKKETVEKKRKEKLAREKKEQKRQAELERIQREEQEIEAQRLLNESLAVEEAFMAEQRAKQRTTTLIAKHMALIEQKIVSVRTIDPSFEVWRKSVVDIKVSPSGVVQSVRTIESSGSPRYDSSVESAIYKASPLPIPNFSQEPVASKEFLNGFEFEVKHPNARR